jgi:hypothetical protein
MPYTEFGGDRLPDDRAALAHVGMVIAPGRNEQQALAEYLIRHPSKKRTQRLAQRGWAKVGKQLIYATRKTIFSVEPLESGEDKV